MTAYYDHGGITIFHCRWEELLPTLVSASVDCLLVDPNYGTTQLEWDVPWDWPLFWKEANRVCMPTAVQMLFSAQPFTTDLIVSNRKNYRYEVVWAKTVPTRFLDANRRPLGAHETLQVFCQSFGNSIYHPQMIQGENRHNRQHGANRAKHYGAMRAMPRSEDQVLNQRFPTTIWEFPNGHQKGNTHNTRKPQALMERCVASWSDRGMLIFDPGIGQGTTLRAAKNRGRRAIGCDMRESCCELSAKLCEQEVMLFDEDGI